MAWETITSGVRPILGLAWNTKPAIAIIKSGFSLNQVACKTFGFSKGQMVKVLVDVEHRLVAVAHIKEGDDSSGALTLRGGGPRLNRKKTPLLVSAKGFRVAVHDRWPDVVQNAYYLEHQGNGLAVAKLTAENKL